MNPTVDGSVQLHDLSCPPLLLPSGEVIAVSQDHLFSFTKPNLQERLCVAMNSSSAIVSMAISVGSDAKELWLCFKDGVVQVRDLQSLQVTRTITTAMVSASVCCFKVIENSAIGNLLLFGLDDGSAYCVNSKDGKAVMRLSGHTAPIRQAEVTGDLASIYTLATDSTLRTWDASTGRCISVKHAPQAVSCFRLIGATIWCASRDGRVFVLNDSDGSLVHEITAHSGDVTDIQRIGKFIWTAGQDTLVKIWGVRTYRCVQILRNHQAQVTSISLAANHILTVGSDGVMVKWTTDVDEPQIAQTTPSFDRTRNSAVLPNHTVDESPILAWRPENSSLRDAEADTSAYDSQRAVSSKLHTTPIHKRLTTELTAVYQTSDEIHSLNEELQDKVSRLEKQIDLISNRVSTLLQGYPRSPMDLQPYLQDISERLMIAHQNCAQELPLQDWGAVIIGLRRRIEEIRVRLDPGHEASDPSQLARNHADYDSILVDSKFLLERLVISWNIAINRLALASDRNRFHIESLNTTSQEWLVCIQQEITSGKISKQDAVDFTREFVKSFRDDIDVLSTIRATILSFAFREQATSRSLGGQSHLAGLTGNQAEADRRIEDLQLRLQELNLQLNSRDDDFARLIETHEDERHKKDMELMSLRQAIEQLNTNAKLSESMMIRMQEEMKQKDSRIDKLVRIVQREEKTSSDAKAKHAAELQKTVFDLKQKHSDEIVGLERKIDLLVASQSQLQMDETRLKGKLADAQAEIRRLADLLHQEKDKSITLTRSIDETASHQEQRAPTMGERTAMRSLSGTERPRPTTQLRAQKSAGDEGSYLSVPVDVLQQEIQKLKRALEQEKKTHTKIQNELTKDLLAAEQDKRALELLVKDLKERIAHDPSSPIATLGNYLSERPEYAQFSNHLRVLSQHVHQVKTLLGESGSVSHQMNQSRSSLEQKFRKYKLQLQTVAVDRTASPARRSTFSDAEVSELMQDFTSFFLVQDSMRVQGLIQARYDANWRALELQLQEMIVIVDLTFQKIQILDNMVQNLDHGPSQDKPRMDISANQPIQDKGMVSSQSPAGFSRGEPRSFDANPPTTIITTKQATEQEHQLDTSLWSQSTVAAQDLGELSPHLRQLIHRNRQQTADLQRLLLNDSSPKKLSTMSESSRGKQVSWS